MKNTDHRLREYFCRCARRLMEQEWAAGRQPTPGHLAELTLQQTHPPCYTLDYDNAIHTLRCLERSASALNSGRGHRGQRAQWIELGERVRQWLDRHPEATFSQAVQHVLTECHPEKWHITKATAVRWLSS